MILEKIKVINDKNLPVVFMGDLNAEPQSNVIFSLKSELNDSREVSIEEPFGPNGTFNGFRFNESVEKRIDYIFVSKKTIVVKKYAVLSDSRNLKYPSDHLPVLVEVTLDKYPEK